MLVLLRRTLPGCFAAAMLAAAPAPTTRPVDNLQIASAVLQLGDPSFQAREKASHQLWIIGSAAEPALARAAAGTDPEIAARAREILADFRFGIHPDAPPKLVELARAYRRGQGQEKRSAISGLFQIGPAAYPVLARIRDAENSPALRTLISSELSSRAVAAVQDYLTQGDLPTAEQFLDIARTGASDAAIRAYAAFHLIRGRLDAKLLQARAQFQVTQSTEDARVLAHLYRAQGDLANARWAAERVEDPELLEKLLFEIGDWKALAHRSQLNADDPADLEKLGFLATYQHLAGDQEGFEQSLAGLRRFANGLRGTNLFVAKILLLNDQPDEAIALHIKHNQVQNAFELLCAQQRFKEAFELADKAQNANSPEAPILQCLHAKTLHTLGQTQRALAMLDQVAAQIQRVVNPAAHRALIEAEFQCGRIDRAFEYCAASLANGRSTSDRLLSALFPQQATEAVLCWNALRRRFPGDEPVQTLSRVRALLEGKCPPEELKTLAGEAPADALRMNSEQRSQFLAFFTRTLVAAGQIDAAHTLLQNVGDSIACMHLGHLAAAKKQWLSAADFYARAMEKDPGSAALRYLRGWALLQAGQREQAQPLLLQSQLMPLANQQQRQILIETLQEAGLLSERREQDELIIRTGEFASRELSDALLRLAAHAHRQGDFLIAALYWQRSMLDCVQPETNFVRQELYLTIPHRLHKLRAAGLLRAGRIEEAFREIELCNTLLPGEITLAIDLVPELERAGRKPDADALFARTLEAAEKLCADYPTSSMLHNNAAWLLVRCRRHLDQALARAAKAVELAPLHTASLDTLAEVHFQRGDRQKAIELINKCIELEPTLDRHKLALKRVQESSPQSDPIE